jgi:replicative DNA helicase
VKRGLPHVIRAEQALLGAVLSDPSGQAHLLDLVTAEDMTRPYHAQVLQAMQRLRSRGVAPGPLAVHEEVKKDTDLPRQVSHDGVVLADLMEASPRPAHAPAYAAMVIGTGIRRRVELAASRMRQAASSGDTSAALRTAAEARRELDACRGRWDALPGEMRRELPTPSSRTRPAQAEAARHLRAVRDEIRLLRQDLVNDSQLELEERLASIAQQVAEVAAARVGEPEWQPSASITSERRAQDRAAETAGTQAVRGLAADPSQITAVRDWLRPSHFARPADGDLYAVMRDMHAAGKPVDPVTVSWEASRRGIQADAADLTGGMGPMAVATAREVQRRGLLAQATQAGYDIQAEAGDPAKSATEILRSARERLRHLEPGVDRAERQRVPAPRSFNTRGGHARVVGRDVDTVVGEYAPEAIP